MNTQKIYDMSIKSGEAPDAAYAKAIQEAQINQTTNITVYGASDPAAYAEPVGNAHENMNARIASNMRGAGR